MVRKRNKIRIIYDILKAIHDRNNKILQTHMLYQSNLSYGSLQQYLKELMLKNMIVEHHDNNKRAYGLTDKGLQYLKQYNVIENFGQVFGLAEEVTD